MGNIQKNIRRSIEDNTEYVLIIIPLSSPFVLQNQLTAAAARQKAEADVLSKRDATAAREAARIAEV